MTGDMILAVLVGLFPAIGLIWVGIWMHRKENRPGGILDHHVRRINELHVELGTKPRKNLAALSWKEGFREISRLEQSLKLKRALGR